MTVRIETERKPLLPSLHEYQAYMMRQQVEELSFRCRQLIQAVQILSYLHDNVIPLSSSGAYDLIGSIEINISAESAPDVVAQLLAAGVHLEDADYCLVENDGQDMVWVSRTVKSTEDGPDSMVERVCVRWLVPYEDTGKCKIETTTNTYRSLVCSTTPDLIGPRTLRGNG